MRNTSLWCGSNLSTGMTLSLPLHLLKFHILVALPPREEYQVPTQSEVNPRDNLRILVKDRDRKPASTMN